MAQPHIDLVVAGTKVFAVALLAPLTQRVGTRPRVTSDPAQAMTLARGPSAMAVVEFLGEGSLSGIQALVRDGAGMRVVVGVPPAHAAAEGTLRALGVHIARWEGDVSGVLAAVEKSLAGAAGATVVAPAASPVPAAPRPPPSAAPAARPAAPVGPGALRPAAPSAPVTAAAPRPPAPAVAPAVARPAAPPAPRPTAPAPSTPAARPATAPAPLAAPPVASPAAARPAPGAPAQAPAGPPPPAAHRPAAVAAAPVAPVAPAPAPAPAAPHLAPPAPIPLFDDAELEADAAPPPPAPAAPANAPVPPDFHAPGVYAPPPVAAPKAAWPSQVADAAEADDALFRAMRGKPDPAVPLDAAAQKLVATLSELERSALVGKALPFDAAPVREAAVVRLRVVAALGAAPAPGTPVDAAAVQALLAEIDGVLARVNALHAAAAPEAQPGLGAVRNALVREAIDFSEAAQRIAQPDAAPQQAPAPVAARAPVTRLIAVDTPAAAEAAHQERRRGLKLAIGLALAGLVAGGYHLSAWLERQNQVVPPPPFQVPAGYSLAPGPRQPPFTLSPTGTADPADFQRFKDAQEKLGRKVYEVAGGMIVVLPPGAAPPRSAVAK